MTDANVQAAFAPLNLLNQVFLFNELLSNLYARLKVQMWADFSLLHRQMGTTFVYVTHDQVEAMTMVYVERGGIMLVTKVFSKKQTQPRQFIRLTIDPYAAHLFDVNQQCYIR